MQKFMPLGGFLLTVYLFTFLSCKDSEKGFEKIDLVLNSLFADHMVLQQQDDVAFWGSYIPSQEVQVSTSWGEKVATTSDAEGRWMLDLKTPEAGGPYEITVSTKDSTITLKDVLVGEVWLASGQSNMEMPLEGFLPNEPIDNYMAEVANANFPQIRYFDVARAIAPKPEINCMGQWHVTSPENANQFSAAGYFFARKLHQELGVPIGVITSSWGGTPVESWMSREKILGLNEFNDELDVLKEENIKLMKDWFSQFPSVHIPNEPEGWATLNLEDGAYSQIDFDDSTWSHSELPAMVEDLATTSNDGAFWFRKTVHLNDISSDYNFSVTQGIDDSDITYVNGKEIGNTFGWNTPREYTIPKELLKPGANAIAIRIIDTGGGGGFMGEVHLRHSATGKIVPINKDWKYKQIAGIQGSNFLLFHGNREALAKSPSGIDSYRLDANTPSVLYNGMIHPLIPYRIKGAIWYQGESNVGRDTQYLKLFTGMIEDWRARWQNDFPFYFVQIAPFDYGNGLSPALRDAQRLSLRTPKTGMAIVMDIGRPKSIHPGNKQDVGDRLARLALANDYGKKIVASGPLYKSHTISEGKIIVEFDYAEDGLANKDPNGSGFEIAGTDKKYFAAKAKIVGNKIELTSPSVREPKYVRYGWKDYIAGSLFNLEGLPASSFTTEE